MGKSIRSKIKKRLRTAKRQRVDAMIVKPREAAHFEALQKVIDGRAVTLVRAPNAFKYPDAAGAVFPQHEVMKPVDFRAQNLPMAGYAFRGNRRKYTGEEEAFMKDIAQNHHPKMEVLAGGGAILAKTGSRVSMHEAELEATKNRNPEVAAIAEAGPSRAASAVAAAVAEDDMEMRDVGQPPAPQGSEAEEKAAEASASADAAPPEPSAEADTSRRPLVKDTRRAQRNRPRANAVKKKGKEKAAAEAKADAKASPTAASAATVTASAPMDLSSSASAAAPAAAEGTSKKKKVKAKKASKPSTAGEAGKMETG